MLRATKEMRVSRKGHVDLLSKVWLFERCSRKELDAIAKVATPLDLPAGKVLTSQGDMGRAFFVGVRGEVKVVREGVLIGTLGSGSFFGEMSLLEDLPRVATVTTAEPTTVLVIHGSDFDKLVGALPSVDRKMLLVLARRLREIEARYVPEPERATSENT